MKSKKLWLKKQQGVFEATSATKSGEFISNLYTRIESNQNGSQMALWNYNNEWWLGKLEFAYKDVYQFRSILVNPLYEGSGLPDWIGRGIFYIFTDSVRQPC